MKIEVEEYHEYDCGSPCTETGCPGHTTDVPISISIGDVVLYTSWYGDISNFDEQEYQDLKAIIGMEVVN